MFTSNDISGLGKFINYELQCTKLIDYVLQCTKPIMLSTYMSKLHPIQFELI